MFTHPTRLSCTGFWVASVSSFLLATTPTMAQIVPDNTLGNESSVVVPNQDIRNIDSDRIDGGAVRGSNLFHSFQEFNVDAGRGAYFANPNGIANILTRVTGENVSNILGRLGVLGNANLFLINPNGIIFGENSSLDIGGSFFATSADRVVFANGSEFSATNPNTPPLLVINIPIGLGFRDNPGSVVNRSVASVVEVDEETGEEFETFFGLQVPSGQTLALLGGEVSLDGGILTTEGGRVELGSVAGNSFVSLIPQNQGFALSYAGVTNFQDIGLSNQALVDTTGEQGGEIQIQGRQVLLTGDSVVRSGTFGAEAGGEVIVRASESVDMSGDATQLGTAALGTGTGGSITIETRRLVVREGAFIEAQTFAEGNAGNLTIRASEAVELVGTTSDDQFPSGLFAEVESAPDSISGQGGTITIETRQLLIQDGAQVSTETASTGQAGNIVIRAFDTVELIGASQNFPSALRAVVESEATGDGGTISIETQQLRVQDGAQISTDTFSAGQAGDLFITASDSIELSGTTVDGNFPSGVFAQVGPTATGNGGNLTVITSRLVVENGAQIATTARNEGNGGDITLNVSDSILLSGTALVSEPDNNQKSGIFVSADEPLRDADGNFLFVDDFGNPLITRGNGGQLNLNTNELNSDITANAQAGPGGRVTINANAIFGTQFRQQQSGASDITATSELGPEFSGTVDLNSEIDTSQGLVELSRDIVDPAALIAQTPCQEGDESEFIITGRGGLPHNPTQGTRQRGVSLSLTEPVEPQQRSHNPPQPRSEAKNRPVSSLDIVPARGWIRTEKGKVILVGYDPTQTQVQRQRQQLPVCQPSQSVEP